MTFSYSGTLTTLVERVRSLIGDVLSTDAQFTDEEITGVASNLSSTDAYVVAISCVHRLVARYARYDDRQRNYEALLESLRRQLIDSGSFNLAGYVGGYSVSDVEDADDDSDDVQPNFKVGMHDNTGASVDDGSDD